MSKSAILLSNCFRTWVESDFQIFKDSQRISKSATDIILSWKSGNAIVRVTQSHLFAQWKISSLGAMVYFHRTPRALIRLIQVIRGSCSQLLIHKILNLANLNWNWINHSMQSIATYRLVSGFGVEAQSMCAITVHLGPAIDRGRLCNIDSEKRQDGARLLKPKVRQVSV
jgi:hypothetical protein